MEKVCGIDVHRDLLVATILDDQSSQARDFQNSLDDINKLKDWLKSHQCKRAVMESTSIYWVPLYLALEEAEFEVTLANAYVVKAIPGRKTDQSDSQWLAHLHMAGLIKPSYVPEKRLRELRELNRLRIKYVQARTAFKNRCHKVLNRVNIRLGSRLKDIFGKAGTEILNGLMAGKTVDYILEHTENHWLKKRSDEVKAVARGALSEMDILELKDLTDTIKHLDEKIGGLDCRIAAIVAVPEAKVVNEKELSIVRSVPGIGARIGAAILGEIGDVRRFSSGRHLASWAGLVPSVYQSAGLSVTGHITKRGSKWLRWSMVEVAHAAVRVRGCRFRALFLRVAAKKGRKVAYVAVARKILTVVWHLLVNGERFVEDGFSKAIEKFKAGWAGHVPLDEMVTVLRGAGYIVIRDLSG